MPLRVVAEVKPFEEMVGMRIVVRIFSLPIILEGLFFRIVFMSKMECV
jgi:hypothetical protein